MPPKKRRAKSKARPTQSQRQSQRVTVNIGTTRAKRKQSGKGKLPPPSHMHNLAPTFVTAQQVDYVGLIGEITRLTSKVQDPVPIRNPVTPLQAVLQASTAEKMAGEAAVRRAGPTAENFQPPPSESDFRLAEQIQSQDDESARQQLSQKVFQSVKGDEEPVAFAEGRPKPGRPFVNMENVARADSLVPRARFEPSVAAAEAFLNTNRAEEPRQLKPKAFSRLNKAELIEVARQRGIDVTGLGIAALKSKLKVPREQEPRP